MTKLRPFRPRRLIWLVAGAAAFLVVALSPPWPVAHAPGGGEAAVLTPQGKAALALFALAAVWWVTEVIPIGVTSILIAVVQVVWRIRDPRAAMTDFMDPSVWFIIGSLVIGRAFLRTGVARRIAYHTVLLAGESTRRLYLASFLMTAGLTLFMAHTAAVAAVFPVLLQIYGRYQEDFARTNFGRGLFIGMAYAAGAGSVVTLLGSARGAVALGYYHDIVGSDIGFAQVTWHLAPLGLAMVLVIWLVVMWRFPPERDRVAGLHAHALAKLREQGRLARREAATLALVLGAFGLLVARSLVPGLAFLDRSAVLMAVTVAFFLLDILDVDDLEELPWNIVLLFGGAMSLGYCLWHTGAARWLALVWLGVLHQAPWFWFLMGTAVLMVVLTNLVMNVAAVAIVMPVALVMGRYVGVSPEAVLFTLLGVAGMPFLLLIGAPPNAIAYESRQFSAWEFFRTGLPLTAALLLLLAGCLLWLWPGQGMPMSG